MRIPFTPFLKISPFKDIQAHSEKIKECTWAFQQAMECYTLDKCSRFEEHRAEVEALEKEAYLIKRRVRGHIPKGAVLPVSKFQLFIYLKEQDKILVSVGKALNWLSYKSESTIPVELQKEFLLLLDSAIDPIEELSEMVLEARRYFRKQTDKQRLAVKKIISRIRDMNSDTQKIEHRFKQNIFNSVGDPILLFHIIKLTEIISSIAVNAENAGDMMRAMIARP